MQIKAKIDRVYNQPLAITLNIENGSFRALSSLKTDDDYKVTIEPWKESRSLNANAYYWSLAQKIAKAMKLPLTAVHNQLLADYGTIDEDIKTIILDDAVDWKKLTTLHLRPTSATKVMANGKLYRVYFVIKGSHEYDTKEMSSLIEGAIQEAKQLDIEILPKEQIEQMLKNWRTNNGTTNH